MFTWFFPSKLNSSEWTEYYQTKYEYHKNAYHWIVVLVCLAEVTYFVSDCQMFGHIAWHMLIPRCAIIPVLVAFEFYWKHHHHYFWNTVFGFLAMHACMWCTIWAVYWLPDRNFVREGFIVMHFGFLALGLAVPYYMSTLLHAGIFLDIILSNQFLHYEYYTMMLSLAVPIYIGTVLLQKIMDNTYVDHYLDSKKLEELSIHDQLTQVYNRNILHSILVPKTNKLALAESKSIWFLLMDIDFFKKINDTYGHESGDQILTTIAERIQNNVREQDFCLRWGGEEFVIILQSVTREEAMATAERIRQSVEQAPAEPPVTVSVGVSHYQGHDYHQAINDADKAMYQAKQNGRNQVVCFDEL